VQVGPALDRIVRQAFRLITPIGYATRLVPLVGNSVKYDLGFVQVQDHITRMQGLRLEVLRGHVAIKRFESIVREQNLTSLVSLIGSGFDQFGPVDQIYRNATQIGFLDLLVFRAGGSQASVDD
jgi:hypothetical protein